MAFSPTVDEHVRSLYVAQEKSIRVVVVIYGSFGAVLIVSSLFLISSIDFLFVPLLLMGFFFFLFAFLMKPLMQLLMRPHFVGEDNANLYVNRRVILSESCLSIESDNGMRSEVPWPVFRKMRVMNSTAYLMIAKQHTVVVPERAFPELQSWQTFLDLCTSKIADSRI